VTSRKRSVDRRLLNLFIIEGVASVGATLLTVGIFFFTEHRFQWDLKRNFMLACGQGAVYVISALGANALGGRWGRRRALIALYALAAAVTMLPLLLKSAPLIVVLVLLSYNVIMGAGWPLLESMVSSDVDAREMSRRLGLYNVVWAGTGAVALAINGTIIQLWAPGVFLTAAIMHAGTALMMALLVSPSRPRKASVAAAAPAAHPEPEPELLAQRRLALWLSRISLPATYMVIYAIAAMMPLLPAMRDMPTSTKTVIGSIWLVTRWVAFWALGATTFWHTRPRLLLWAACAMLAAFLGISVRPSDLFPSADLPAWIDLLSMILWQGILGVALGMIYSGSLYFGMVLSDGSTEHGGYHEALIGLGSVLGPGVGLLAMTISSRGIRAGIIGVAAIVGATVLAAAAASVYAGRSRANGTGLAQTRLKLSGRGRV
jgi:MFS family permease